MSNAAKPQRMGLAWLFRNGQPAQHGRATTDTGGQAEARAKVESCPHREPFTPEDPSCWCPRWRCNAGQYSRAWMKPTDGVYVSDCLACLRSEGGA